jgi:hypothetical protein
MNRYSKNNRNADGPNWLSIYDAGEVIIDRKSGNPPVLHIPRAAVSIVGGIQPDILRRVFGTEEIESGTLARFTPVHPPGEPVELRQAAVSFETHGAYVRLLEELVQIPLAQDPAGECTPHPVRFTPDAFRKFRQWFNGHAKELTEFEGPLNYALAKLRGKCVRLALIFHMIRLGREGCARPIDGETLSRAIALTEWLRHETCRVYAMLDETVEARERRQLAEKIRREGGLVAPRDLMRFSRTYRKAEDAEQALQDLVEAGLGMWEESPTTAKGGRPTRRFRLFDDPGVDTTSVNTEENRVVSTAEHSDPVNDVPADAGAEDSDDDWGAV